jgi:hypothetical protein
MPTKGELDEMHAFNKSYLDSGVILHADGFLASKTGARVSYSKDAAPTVQNGPFGLDNLIAGYWILKLATFEEAVNFAKKAPFKEGYVEVRQIAGEEDFGDALSDEIRDAIRERS